MCTRPTVLSFIHHSNHMHHIICLLWQPKITKRIMHHSCGYHFDPHHPPTKAPHPPREQQSLAKSSCFCKKVQHLQCKKHSSGSVKGAGQRTQSFYRSPKLHTSKSVPNLKQVCSIEAIFWKPTGTKGSTATVTMTGYPDKSCVLEAWKSIISNDLSIQKHRRLFSTTITFMFD